MITSLRLVSYNILEGFRPTSREAEDRRGIDRDRAQCAKRLIADLAPDILVLNEALFCHQYAGKTVDYGHLFDFPHQSAALYDDAWGNAILSRFPIVQSQEMRIYNRGGLISTIDTPLGNVTVASYHPHPGRYPENKAEDFSRLVSGSSGPLIVCGDLNCINPDDSPERVKLIESFRAFSMEPEKAVDRFIDSGKFVFQTLGALGLRDAVPLEGRRYSMPTDLINMDKTSGMRIDHILANDMIDAVSGEVVHSALSNQASDHHPVMVEFKIRSS